ncbi:zinc finger homeobox protein 4 [Trichonephila clavata]|uniref:Zinc finger homeobox protein 4 n=1 Tax=Trichonephila clavata TaxID=2740835 RepID=A0A8X6GF33_TRICU|nr:zinc finger homeobox protein 4 [Trichonephila clavata]
MNETLKLKLKRSDSGEDSGEWSCESPESSSLERHGGKEFIENTRSKRKFTGNIKSSKNRKGVIARTKRIKKGVLQLRKPVFEVALKENQVENFSGRNLISDETSGRLSATDDQDSCNEIAGDLKARLNDETSMENLTEKETGSVSAIEKRLLEYKIACGIEDISDASTDSYSISDRSFNGTSHEDVKNVRYGECTTAGMSSSSVCVQEGNSKNPNLNVSNLETLTHRYRHYGSGTIAINCGKNLCPDSNLNMYNVGLIREQENDESKRELSGEKVLEGFSDKRDHKPASPLEVSNFTTQFHLSTKMTNIDKYVDGASSNSTPTSFGKYLPPSYNAIKMSDHNKEGSSNLIQMPSIETLLPPSNPYMAILDSKGTPIANPYNFTGTIIKPTLIKCKENEAVNFSSPNGSPGTSAPSISVKRPVESKRKEQNKRFKCYVCEYVTNSDSEFHMHQVRHTYPVGGLQMINQINAFQNPANVNALYWRSNGCVHLGGNPRFRHPFYYPMYRLPEMSMLGANSYLIPASGQNCLADSGARNSPVDLARLQSTGAQSYEGTDGSLRAPVVDISSGKVFSCCVCRNFSTDSPQDITEHVLKDRSKHDDSIRNDGEVSTCTVCNFETRSQQTMVVHSKNKQHLMKVDHSNHIKEGGCSKSYQYTLAHTEIPGTVYLYCSVCSYYAESLPKFQKHTTFSNHINNVKFKKFLESFETEREYYICKSCDKTLRSRNDLFVHSTSNEHRTAEYRLLTAHGDRNLGGIYIMKETRRVEREPKENVEENTTTSTSAKVESKKKKRNYSRRSLHQNESRESTKKVSDNNTKVKKIGSREIDSSLSEEGERAYCSLCPARFSKSSDCMIHLKEVHAAGNYSAMTSLIEMAAEKQLSPGNKQVTGTFKGTNTVTDAKQNSRTNACVTKRNGVLSELNSNTDDSERSIGFRKQTKTNLDNITNRTDESLTDQSLYLRNKMNALESESVNFIPSAFSQNNGESSLSTRDIESNSGYNSESSEIDVG